MANVDNYCEEIIWYSKKDEKTGKWIIPIVIDFDYCITKESSWLNGTFTENPGCFDVLRRWADEFGVVYILETMRGPSRVQPAVDYCKDNGIEFFGIGRNPLQADDEDATCKCWGLFDIDDRNAGTFLKFPSDKRPYIDWELMGMWLSPILKQICQRLPEMEDDVLGRKAEVEGKHNAIK
jgi:hypothetical protein